MITARSCDNAREQVSQIEQPPVATVVEQNMAARAHQKGVSENERGSQSSDIFFHEINDGLQTQASIFSLNGFVNTHPELRSQGAGSQPRIRRSSSESSDPVDPSSSS